MRRLRHEFEMTLDARVSERTRIARELHDTLLQSFHGLMLRFGAVDSGYCPNRAEEAKEKLRGAMAQAAEAITEGRDAVQALRESTVRESTISFSPYGLSEKSSRLMQAISGLSFV